MRIFNNINNCYEIFIVYSLKQVNKIGRDDDIKFFSVESYFCYTNINEIIREYFRTHYIL